MGILDTFLQSVYSGQPIQQQSVPIQSVLSNLSQPQTYSSSAQPREVMGPPGPPSGWQPSGSTGIINTQDTQNYSSQPTQQDIANMVNAALAQQAAQEKSAQVAAQQAQIDAQNRAAQAARAVAEEQKKKFASIDTSLFQLPTQGQMDTWLSQAFDKLKPYYEQKLAESKGDFTEASRRVEEDYVTGRRYAEQEFGLGTQREQEDIASTLQKLGVSFTAEDQAKQDVLNKRGIALVQDPYQPNRATQATRGQVSYDTQGNPVYLGQGGQAGYELSMLKEDQDLRKQAEQRASQRNIQDIGLKFEKTTEGLGQEKQKSAYDVGRGYQKDLTALQQEKEAKATEMAGRTEQRDIAQKQQKLQEEMFKKQFG